MTQPMAQPLQHGNRGIIHKDDDSLGAAVEKAFQERGYWQLLRIETSATGGVVTLRGQVPSYYLRQVAQTTAMNLPGVDRVEDRIEVIHD